MTQLVDRHVFPEVVGEIVDERCARRVVTSLAAAGVKARGEPAQTVSVSEHADNYWMAQLRDSSLLRCRHVCRPVRATDDPDEEPH